MNYYEARQRESDKVWHWTVMNDGHVRPTQGCSADCMHETREEAERHHYEWKLDNLIERRLVDQQLRCEVPECGAWTQRTLDVRGLISVGAALCDLHCDRNGFTLAHPFHAGEIGVSS